MRLEVNPILKRDVIVAVRRREPFRDRIWALAQMLGVMLVVLLVWKWKGWDQSAEELMTLARTVFILGVVVQLLQAVGFVFPVSGRIALERDKKSLDALLTTELSSAQIVLGVMTAGILRTLSILVSTVPLLCLVAYLGGIDLRWVGLACLGTITTTLVATAICAVATVESRTYRLAPGIAAIFLEAWLLLPIFALTLRGRYLRFMPPWFWEPFLWGLDSGPVGLMANRLGLYPRPWGLVHGILRMSALQAVIFVATTAWAIARLRPASRGAYDSEGRISLRKRLRRATWKRKACGDDPIFWNESHSQRVQNRLHRLLRPPLTAGAMLMLCIGVSWFAIPAFHELREHGYGSSTNAMPETNPLTRVIVEHIAISTGAKALPGQARLEFNLAIRQFSAAVCLGFLISTLSNGALSITRERERDTWLGVLSTPLSAREIIRGKVLGVLWKERETIATILIVWMLGLAVGALHPAGFLLALIWTSLVAAAYTTIGIGYALVFATEPPFTPTKSPQILVSIMGLLALTILPALIVPALLLSYEEFGNIFYNQPYLLLQGTPLQGRIGSRALALIFLVAFTSTLICAWLFWRTLVRRFDPIVGRPQSLTSPKHKRVNLFVFAQIKL